MEDDDRAAVTPTQWLTRIYDDLREYVVPDRVGDEDTGYIVSLSMSKDFDIDEMIDAMAAMKEYDLRVLFAHTLVAFAIERTGNLLTEKALEK